MTLFNRSERSDKTFMCGNESKSHIIKPTVDRDNNMSFAAILKGDGKNFQMPIEKQMVMELKDL